MENYKNMKLLRRESAGLIKVSFFCIEQIEDNIQKTLNGTILEENWECYKVASVFLSALKENAVSIDRFLTRYQEIINDEKQNPSRPEKGKLKVHLLCIEKYKGYLKDIREHIAIFDDSIKGYQNSLILLEYNSKLNIFEYTHKKMIEG